MLWQPFCGLHVNQAKVVHNLAAKPVQTVLLAIIGQHRFREAAFSRAQVGAENARLNPGDTLPEITMPATMHAAAGANHLWISASNSSRRLLQITLTACLVAP